MHNERSFARRALARVYGSVYGNTVNSYLLPKCVLGRSRLRASSPAEHTTFYRGSYSNAHEHTKAVVTTLYTHRYIHIQLTRIKLLLRKRSRRAPRRPRGARPRPPRRRARAPRTPHSTLPLHTTLAPTEAPSHTPGVTCAAETAEARRPGLWRCGRARSPAEGCCILYSDV